MGVGERVVWNLGCASQGEQGKREMMVVARTPVVKACEVGRKMDYLCKSNNFIGMGEIGGSTGRTIRGIVLNR